MTAEQQEWTPANDRQHPPFEAGNEMALRHGAWSPRRVDPIATDMVALVDNDPAISWLTPADRPALWSWAKAEAQAALLSEYLEKAGEATGDGVGDLEDARVLAAYALLHRAETRAASGRSRLGLDPLSRAKLGRDIAAARVDLASLLSDAREAAERDGEPA